MKRITCPIRVAGDAPGYLLPEPEGTATGLLLSLDGSRSSADREHG
jgi:hypothetical protein